jgi:hypothetical protein
MPRFCFAALITALMVARANAQIASATSLVGTVTDSTGRTVPFARVSAQNQGSGDAYSAITNDQGYYSIQFIHVGRYNLNVERSGFQRFEKTGIVVDANQVVRNDVTLAVGSTSQSVVIETSAQVIKTDSASVSETITSRDVTELPLNGRDPMRLATTTPGGARGILRAALADWQINGITVGRTQLPRSTGRS